MPLQGFPVILTAGLPRPTSTIFVSDTFTGTDGTTITSHTPEIGSTWIRASTYSNPVPVLDNSNRLRPNDNGGAVIYNNATPPSADYSISADMIVVTNLGSMLTLVCGRYDDATDNGYYAYWYGDGSVIQMAKGSLNAGTTPLGTGFSATPSDGSSHNVQMTMAGSTLTLFVDGIQRDQVTDSTYTNVGKAGLSIRITSTNANGFRIDNFLAQ